MCVLENPSVRPGLSWNILRWMGHCVTASLGLGVGTLRVGKFMVESGRGVFGGRLGGLGRREGRGRWGNGRFANRPYGEEDGEGNQGGG